MSAHPEFSLSVDTVECRHRYRRCLLERQVGRLEHDPVLARTEVLRERPVTRTEYLITWLELRGFRADRLDSARNVSVGYWSASACAAPSLRAPRTEYPSPGASPRD